jgi:hypothetical protein
MVAFGTNYIYIYIYIEIPNFEKKYFFLKEIFLKNKLKRKMKNVLKYFEIFCVSPNGIFWS